MAKPKIQSRSKYIKNNLPADTCGEASLKVRAEEFLSSGTPASYVTQVALALIILSGAAAIGALAPGLTVAARQYQRSKSYSNKQLRDSISGLKRNGYLEEYMGEKGTPRVQLTKKGKVHFQRILFDEVRLPEPKDWGGKWTFVLFDIPEKYTNARDALRWRLKALGFYQYQKSVWVYPHPCEKEILFVADYFGVGKFVEVLSVDHLSEDKELKKHFELP
ncbi:MAG: hypothetical protein WC878_04450 [Candidatus Paceibacterota bacterium]|jgi:hypothetical protein